MALPGGGTNLHGHNVAPVADMALKTVGTANEAVTGTTVRTGLPSTVVIVAKMTSGGCQLDAKIGSVSPITVFSSPDDSKNLTDTTKHSLYFNTTAANPLFAVKQTFGASGGTMADHRCLVLTQTALGETSSCPENAQNAAASSIAGDGSGVVTLTSG